LPYLVLAAIVAGGGVLSIFLWQWSNSNEFCGQVCHDVMYSYATTYAHSTHTRVDCVECHMGRTPLRDRLPRKIFHVRELYGVVTGDYEQPLIARSLRPARETCELCHYPPQFFHDSVVEIPHYTGDADNTSVTTWLIMKTGGGLRREGLGYGIHWHIENKVYYYATDKFRQNIPWMRVVDAEGNVVEYMDVNFEPPEGFPREEDLRLMDCIDCHNLTGHKMLSPEEIVDGALRRGQIARDLPYIRWLGVTILGEEYTTTSQALQAIEGLETWYADNRPDIYTTRQDEIRQAVDVLKALYQANAFPEAKVNWQTYPDNLGHRDWPGCFRCHDGRHISPQNGVVRVECNLCHSIPEVVQGGGGPTISLSKGPEPASHLDTAWLHRHPLVFDDTCALCHEVVNPGGADNSGFCSNSACHGVEWQFADLDAPGLADRLGIKPAAQPEVTLTAEESPTYLGSIGPLLQARCGQCHGIAAGLDVTTYEGLMAGSERGPVIVPGDPESSRIVEVLRGDHFARLSATELDVLIRWIAGGAPEQ